MLPPVVPTVPTPLAPVVVAPAHPTANTIGSVAGGPRYGALPTGDEESRARARRLRDDANERRRTRRRQGRLIVALVVVAAAAGAAFALFTTRSDGTTSVEPTTPTTSPSSEPAVTEPVTAAPETTATGATLPIPLDVLLPTAVLAHTQPLPEANGLEYYAVAAGSLAAADPAAHTALLTLLESLPTAAPDDPRLQMAPVVAPGDIAIALRRDGADVVELIVRCAAPPLSSALP